MSNRSQLVLYIALAVVAAAILPGFFGAQAAAAKDEAKAAEVKDEAKAAPAAAPAGAAPAGGAYKIAVVDRKKVYDGSKEQQQGSAALEQEVKQLQTKIDALSTTIEADKKKYEDGKDTMPEEQRTALEDKIKSDFREYQSQFKQLQADIDTRHGRLIKKIRTEIDAVITKIGTKDNYHMILEGDPMSGTSVLYYSSTIDITTKVLEQLNSQAK